MSASSSEQKIRFAVMGAGHGGLAMAGHLGLLGFPVSLYNRTIERVHPVRARRGVSVSGIVQGFGRVDRATDDAEEALRDAKVVMVVVPASAHREIAKVCAPHLVDGQCVVLNPGRTLGALEFYQVLKQEGCKADIILGEAQTFIYASRVTGPAQAHIFALKNAVPLATLQAYRIPECLTLVGQAFPQFVPGDNLLKTSFNNIGAVFHPAIVVLNTGWIEDPQDFEFYHQGVSESVAVVLEKIDAERVAVAASLGIQAMTARQWLYLAYDAVGKSLLSAMRDNPGYRGIAAPKTTEMRYVSEDVPFSLVPISSLGRMTNTPTPTIDAVITLASTMHVRDYRAEGRTVEKLGISGMDLRQLRLLAIGEEGDSGSGNQGPSR